MERDQWCVDVDADERQRFDEVLERALAELEPVCLAEQNFCVSFFQLDVLSPTTKVCAFIFHNAFGHEQSLRQVCNVFASYSKSKVVP